MSKAKGLCIFHFQNKVVKYWPDENTENKENDREMLMPLVVLTIPSVFLGIFIYDPLKIDFQIFLFITLASIFINLAIFLSTYAFKAAQKYYASIFCLVYLQIVWSSIAGFYFFNEYLNAFALLGAILIVFSGIISIPGQIRQVNEK